LVAFLKYMPVPFVLRYIAEGEHQQQDFKMRVDDSKKIARTLAAFANTDGGRLLIGVKDNGNIAGVNAEEEVHMLEAAAKMYCKPPIHFEINAWKVDFKTILDVWVEPSSNKPHSCITEENQWKHFIRRDDQNLPAPAVLIEVWRTHDHDRTERYFHTEKEKKIFDVLEHTKGASFSMIQRNTGIHKSVLVKLLARFIRWGLIELYFVQDQSMYRLK